MVEKFCAANTSKRPWSVFEDTWKMCPGTYLILENGKITLHTYWDIREKKGRGRDASAYL